MPGVRPIAATGTNLLRLSLQASRVPAPAARSYTRPVMICAQCGHENPETNKFCGECAAPLTAATKHGPEVRKTVTVLFCDLTGSTELGEALDPERLRALLARYFERMKAIVERHGGSVEKFIGDAVMAVFGVPVLHEDDALRAVRAAVEMRDALPELGLRGRIGVMTGRGGDGDGGAAGDGRCGERGGAVGAGGAAGRGAGRRPDAGARSRRGRGRADRAARVEGQVRARSPPIGCCGCATRRSAGTGSCSWAVSASSRSCGRHGSACGPSSAASW